MLRFHCRSRTFRFLCLQLHVRSPGLGVLHTAIWGCFWVCLYTSALVVLFFFCLRTALRTVAVLGCSGLPSWWHDQSSIHVVGFWSELSQCSVTLLSQVLPGSRFCFASEYSWLFIYMTCTPQESRLSIISPRDLVWSTLLNGKILHAFLWVGSRVFWISHGHYRLVSMTYARTELDVQSQEFQLAPCYCRFQKKCHRIN